MSDSGSDRTRPGAGTRLRSAERAAIASFLVAASSAAVPGDPPTMPAVAAPYAAPAKLQVLAPAPDLERQLDEIDREERSAKKQLEEISREADRARTRLLARGRAYARAAAQGLLPASDGFDALVDHAARLQRLHTALARDLTLNQAFTRRRVEVGQRFDELRARRNPLEAQLEAMKQARTAVLAEQDRVLAFERAFSGNSAPGDHTAVYGSGVGPTDPSELTSGFASLKGRLPFPIPGRSEIHSARRADGPGLEMRAPRGTPVRAVYPGRVAFADRYADYGKTVIVEHGDRHYTVSANLDEIGVHVGDDVTTGSRIGTVGDAGAGPLLYFEIRIGTEAADPAEWFGI